MSAIGSSRVQNRGLRWAVVGIGAVVALTVLLRWMQGRDVLTGIDPVTAAATAHDDVEIHSLFDSGASFFAVTRRGAKEAAYFRLRPRLLFSMPAEHLTAPIAWKDCAAVVPDWIPIFQPTARQPLCIELRTDVGESPVARTSLSLVVARYRLRAAIDFYASAFSRARLGPTGAVTIDLLSSSLDDFAVVAGELHFSAPDGSRRAELSYFRGERSAEAVIIVEYPGAQKAVDGRM